MAYRRFNITYIAMIIGIFPLGIFILSAINVNLNSVSTILEEISSSLNDYPLSNLNYAENCSSNEYNGNLFTFPGSVEGCTCSHVYYYRVEQEGKYEVNPGTCDHNQTINGCVDIKEIKEKKLDAWNKKRFCSKFYNTPSSSFKGYLYFLNNSALENEECKSGFKKCGKLDDMGNYLCMPENEECPINDIISSRTKREDLENKNYSFIMVNDKYLYYSNQEVDKPVISKFKVVEGKLCTDRTYFHTDYPQYILDKQFAYYGCRHKINDQLYEDYVELDSMTKGEFYNGSGLNLDTRSYYHDFYDDYPFYSLEANVSLYSQRYIGYDKKCLMENGALNIENSIFNEEKINEMDQVISNTLFVNDFTKWFSIVFIAVEIFSCAAFPIDTEDTVLWILLWALANILCHIGMAVPLYIDLSKIKQFTEFPLCGNALINSKLNYYHSIGNTLKTTIVLGIVFVNLQLAFIIVILILRFFAQYDIYHENKAPLVEHQKSSNIDYKKSPEDPYYSSSDFNNNNPTPSTDFNNNMDNNNLQGNNKYVNPNSASSGTDNPNPPEQSN